MGKNNGNPDPVCEIKTSKSFKAKRNHLFCIYIHLKFHVQLKLRMSEWVNLCLTSHQQPKRPYKVREFSMKKVI